MQVDRLSSESIDDDPDLLFSASLFHDNKSYTSCDVLYRSNSTRHYKGTCIMPDLTVGDFELRVVSEDGNQVGGAPARFTIDRCPATY